MSDAAWYTIAVILGVLIVVLSCMEVFGRDSGWGRRG